MFLFYNKETPAVFGSYSCTVPFLSISGKTSSRAKPKSQEYALGSPKRSLRKNNGVRRVRQQESVRILVYILENQRSKAYFIDLRIPYGSLHKAKTAP
jgi:hypothetical protein